MSQPINPSALAIFGASSLAAGPSPVSQAIAAQPGRIREMNDAFVREPRPHALLITNHGYPGPDIRWPSGGPDSGGQIKYVNKVAESLTGLGYKVTVAARSFRPDSQNSKYGDRRGVDFFAGDPLARYVYVPGVSPDFITKEQLFAELPVIAANLARFIGEEARSQGVEPWRHIAWINSHYWDGGVIGQLLVRSWQEEIVSRWISEKFSGAAVDAAGNMIAGMAAYLDGDAELAVLLEGANRHAWTSHSLGTLKQKNMDDMPRPSDADEAKRKLKDKIRRWEYMAMNFPMREQVERALVGGAAVAFGSMLYPNVSPARVLAYTSVDILEHTRMLGAPDDAAMVRFPPGTDFDVFYPRAGVGDDGVKTLFDFMEGKIKDSTRVVPEDVVRRMKEDPQSLNVIVEASRMDETKRKHIAIEALSRLPEDTILLMSGKPDGDERVVFNGLKALIDELGLSARAFLLGMVPDELMGPLCSLPHGDGGDRFRLAMAVGASRMEGWGMSVMDEVAGGLPLVASDRTPYAVHVKNANDGVIVVPLGEDEPQRYADALMSLIDHPEKAREMAARGREATREFKWDELTRSFVAGIEEMFGAR